MSSTKHLLEKFERLHPKQIELGLERVTDLLGKMDNPHQNLPPTIHIAGTNGKGSVTAYLTKMLECHNALVHNYTSPHLIRFHERIRLASKEGATPISDDLLFDRLSRVDSAIDGATITFFESTTIAAFLSFSEHVADYLILETGLGGRLDATNVIEQPALTILTPISIDHTDYLGSNLGDIAREKVGILKENVPVIIARQPDEAFNVIMSEAEKKNCPMIVEGVDYDCFEQEGRLIYQTEQVFFDLSLPRYMIGHHQRSNAGIAITALRHLLETSHNGRETTGRVLSVAGIDQALQATNWPGRLQRLDHSHYRTSDLPFRDEIWLDGGHNMAAARTLAGTMADMEEQSSKPLHLIIGMMKDKDVRGFLKPFSGLAKQVISIPIPGEERAQDPDKIASIALDLGFEADSAPNLSTAMQMSAMSRTHSCRLLICGSLYLAGHILGEYEAIN